MLLNFKDLNLDNFFLRLGICEILFVVNNFVCYFKDYFLDNIVLNKNCI